MKKHILSKSTFVRGSQCVKSLYLNKHHHELRDEISEQQQAIFSMGHDIGKLAQQLFPGGTLAVPEDEIPGFKAAQYTQQLIDSGCKVIYEACFVYDDVLVALDILVNKRGKWYAYEVKGSTSVSDTYVLDASIQYYVITGKGIPLQDISIVHINNQYVRNGEIDVKQLFAIESVKELIQDNLKMIPARIKEFRKILEGKNIPEIDIGAHCSNPYPCDFTGHCWKHIPFPSVFDISRLSFDKKMELYNDGIIRFEDIPEDFSMNDNQWLQVSSYLNNEEYTDVKSVKQFLHQLKYPLYYLDFETIMPGVPMFDQSRPYQQICFQYSLHIQSTLGASVKHLSFLAKNTGDPRIPFIEKLFSDIGKKGTILVYNLSFEKTRLLEIALNFPDYAKQINAITCRMIDLMIPFAQKMIYRPEMHGSYSIKKVLPALIPEMNYSELNIQEGGSASNAFINLYFEKDAEKIRQIRNDLENYCKMDTYAMVKIIEKMQQLIS